MSSTAQGVVGENLGGGHGLQSGSPLRQRFRTRAPSAVRRSATASRSARRLHQALMGPSGGLRAAEKKPSKARGRLYSASCKSRWDSELDVGP